MALTVAVFHYPALIVVGYVHVDPPLTITPLNEDVSGPGVVRQGPLGLEPAWLGRR
jgi:hypothetical protein